MVRRKCTAIAEMAQVGVRKRAARSLARRRKVNGQKLMSTSARADCINKLRRRSGRRRATVKPEHSATPSAAAAEVEERCSSASSDQAAASCCSSNGSSERIKFADLEDGDDDESVEVETSMYYSCRDRRSETLPSRELGAESSDDLDSTARLSEADSRLKPTAEKMPTHSEIDEFFAEAEKTLQKQFKEKYNFDIVKDEALEGRYEWVRLKP